MKIRMIAALTAVIMAGTPVLAQAQGYGHPGGQDRHDDRGQNDARDRHDDRGQNDARDRHDDRGNGQHNWRKGQRLPREYWGRDREVSDWHARHLRQPPRGYHWVRDDSGNYILAALAGGLIASIIAGNH
jgi:Ni/Co efflux regulator RcnB